MSKTVSNFIDNSDDKIVKLWELKINESGIIHTVKADKDMERRLLDLGFVEGTEITCILRKPKGSIAACLIRGTLIALRKKDMDGIWVVVS